MEGSRCHRIARFSAQSHRKRPNGRTAEGGHDSCDCRGFERHSHCKHVEAVKAILENAYFWGQTAAIPPAPAATASAPKKPANTALDLANDAAYRW